MLNIQKNVPLKDYTTLRIGGTARYFVEVRTPHEIKEAIKFAKNKNINFFILAGGSDLLISDEGYDGLVIKNNHIGISVNIDGKVSCYGAMSLQGFIDTLNTQGLEGAEKLAGIPGTVGGAIYGNAGAYGTTISDHLIKVKVFDGKRELWMSKEECRFDYRHSIFKEKKNLVILEAEFLFKKGDPETLKKTSGETIKLRSKKYFPGIRCPGSFFKNLLLANLPQEIANIAPKDYYGKLPSGWLLEQVGAKGSSKGKIKIADYHANLFINDGGGTAQDFFDLAREYKQKVKEKFGVDLEPEVQLVGFKETL